MLLVICVKQHNISIILHILGGFLICQYQEGLKYIVFWNFMTSMLVFKIFSKITIDHHQEDQVSPLVFWSSNVYLLRKDT